jgi:hypothetical protein
MEQLTARGFAECATGGNCRAMVRTRGNFTDVITDIGGLDLPTESDWHFCTYAGDWLADVGADAPLASLTSDDCQLHLIACVDVRQERAESR